MSGIGLLALVLTSMGWLFFLAGVVVNWRSRPGIPLLPGLVGSVTVFFSIPPLIHRRLDDGCLPGLLRGCANRMRGSL